MKSIKDIVARYKDEREESKITTDYQALGYKIANKLHDKKNIGIYMKLAKNEREEILNQALNFVIDYPDCDNFVALFLWKVKELKREHKIVPITNTRAVDIAIEILQNDKIIIIPSDTVYMVVSRLYSEKAVKKLYKAKSRSAYNPVPILIGEKADLKDVSKDIPEKLKNLIDKYWPGPLAVILKVDNDDLYPKRVLNRKEKKVAVRLPDNDWVRELIKKLGEPIVVSAACFQGKKISAKFEEIEDDFLDKVDLAIRDPQISIGNKPSTVVGLDNEGNLRFPREGVIPKAMITG